MTGPSEPEGQSRPFEPMPSAPALNEQELSQVAVARPKSVDNAFLAWIIATAIGIVGLIVSLTLGSDQIRDTARASLERQGRSFTEQDVDNLATLSKTIAIVIVLILTALYLFFMFKMRAGRNWARITLTVLGALGVVFIVINLGSAAAVSLVISLVQAVLIVAAVVFMYRPDANQYFSAGRPRR